MTCVDCPKCGARFDPSKASHVRGPWHLSEPKKGHREVNGGNWYAFAEVVVEVSGQPSAQGEANARLIVAAPTMFDYIKDRAAFDDRARKILEAIQP